MRTLNKNFILINIIDNLHFIYSISINIFGLIFFYKLFNHSILIAFSILASGHIFQIIFTVHSAKIIGKIGTNNALILSIILRAVASIPIFLYQSSFLPILAIIWFLIIKSSQIFYFPSIIYLFGQYTSHKYRGSQLAFQHALAIISATTTPILAGLIINQFSFSFLIIIVTLISSLTLIPILALPSFHFKSEINFKNLFFKKSVRKLWHFNFISSLDFSGAKSVWTIFLFLSLFESYKSLGILLTLTAIISIGTVFIFGKFLDYHNRERSLSYGFLFSSFAHFLKIIPLPLVINDSIDKISRRLRAEANMTLNYDLMNDYIKTEKRDEMVIFREIIVNSSSAIILILSGILVTLFGFQITFMTLASSILLLTLKF